MAGFISRTPGQGPRALRGRVDGAGNRRNVDDCAGWTTPGSATAGNDGKTDVGWTAGDCTHIDPSSALPIFCVQQ